MKRLRFKVALWKRKYHLWQLARVKRKLSALRTKLLDILQAEEGE